MSDGQTFQPEAPVTPPAGTEPATSSPGGGHIARNLLIIFAVLAAAAALVWAYFAFLYGVGVPDVAGKTKAQAGTALAAAGLTLGDVSYDDAAEGAAGAVISQDPRPGTRVAGGKPVDVVIAGPPPVMTPDVEGMTQAAASSALATAGLTTGDVTEAYHETVAKGLVCSQAPDADVEVPRGSEVALVISRGKQPVPVPDVVGRPIADAKRLLAAAGFGYKATRKSASQPKNTVLSQSPKGGAKAQPGTTVSLALSTGVKLVRVPNVHGMWADQADETIRDAGLKPAGVAIHGPIEPDATDIGRAYRQRPRAGTLVPKGTMVTYHYWWESG